MADNSQDAYISTHTVIFAKNIIRSLEDMVGTSFMLNKDSLRKKPFSSDFNMIAYIHFAGTVQGDYILCLDEISALKLADMYEDGLSDDDIREMRDDYGGFVKELLNLAVGQSLPELEQSFGYLTYTPGTVVYGEIDFPDIMSGNIKIESTNEEMLCGFSLNLAELKIGRKLEQTLLELKEKTAEAKKARKEIEGILKLIPSGLVAVDSEGIILPGYSLATAKVVGYDSETELDGLHVTTLLGLDSVASDNLSKCINNVFLQYGSLPLEQIFMMCEDEFTNNRGKTFKLDWLPAVSYETESVEKLLIMIELET
ncbi:MAG: chemotaxis protein CheX [Desulfobacterales bacterium]|nr:chemotaxis protein CheX [Desulfobacterales bacterium]